MRHFTVKTCLINQRKPADLLDWLVQSCFIPVGITYIQSESVTEKSGIMQDLQPKSYSRLKSNSWLKSYGRLRSFQKIKESQ